MFSGIFRGYNMGTLVFSIGILRGCKIWTGFCSVSFFVVLQIEEYFDYHFTLFSVMHYIVYVSCGMYNSTKLNKL